MGGTTGMKQEYYERVTAMVHEGNFWWESCFIRFWEIFCLIKWRSSHAILVEVGKYLTTVLLLLV